LESWEDVQRKRFAVVDFSLVHDMLTKAADWDIDFKSLESPLLVVESIRNSCKIKKHAVIRKIFVAKGSMKCKRADCVIFNDWMDHALGILDRQKSNPESVRGTAALYLLVAIVNLIGDCYIIENKKQLNVLKGRKIDWEKSLQEVSSAGSMFLNVIHVH
jgi:hypothetical protein